MSNLFLFFIIVIPILLVGVGFYGYNLYQEMNRARKIIDTLSDSQAMILEEKRKSGLGEKDEDNWLKKKLQYAGFEQDKAYIVFIIISLAFGGLVSFFAYSVIKSVIALSVSFVIFTFIPLILLIKLINLREEEFNTNLKEIIDKVTSMMKSGVGFEQALKKSVITCKSDFTRDVFNIYINEKNIIGEDKAFEKMFKLVDSKELRIFYLTISIGRQSGGKFSNTLEKLRKTLRDQGEIKQEITSSTKEIKVGSYMILALVVIIYIMMNHSLDDRLDAHFFGTSEGKIQMFFIALWVAFGLFVNNMLTKVK